ncbi:MAG: proB [Fusobacteriales bacterium]|nr:proB [Fusobacteriales bacterium]
MRKIADIKNIVVKIGSSTLTYENGHLNLVRIEKIVRYIVELMNRGYKVTLVSSGAIGAGMGKLGYETRPKTIPEKQALAAVGQVALIHIYQKFFSEYSKNVAQVLLTMDDFSNRERYINARNSMRVLLEKGIIPIINENDVVVIDEIKVGDNDSLSAYVSAIVEADLLIILSDIDGLYDDNPKENKNAKLIKTVENIDDNIKKLAKGAGSKFGTGGMATKIKAAEICTNFGIAMIIAHGENPYNLIEILEGKEIGTYFKSNSKKLNHKKHWIKYSSKKEGIIYIDSGAVKAMQKHKSLLAIGIKKVEGFFEKGSSILIKDMENNEIGVGLINYSSEELNKIIGKKSSEIEKILGYKDYDEVIHIDNMYIN